MFFILSKIIWFIVKPSNFISFILLSGFCVFLRKPNAGRKLIYIGLALLLFSSLDFIPHYLMLLLENRISQGAISDKIDGIIILSGMVDKDASRSGSIELTEQADRIVEGVVLARRFPCAKLIITGSSGELTYGRKFIEADYLGTLAILLGVEEDRILVERNARNTHEHALELSKILSKEQDFILITSAFHMPRSYGCFRKEGFKTIPYPVDYTTKVNLFKNISMDTFLPKLENLNVLNIAVHEWLGLFIYRLYNYTDSFFPNAK